MKYSLTLSSTKTTFNNLLCTLNKWLKVQFLERPLQACSHIKMPKLNDSGC